MAKKENNNSKRKIKKNKNSKRKMQEKQRNIQRKTKSCPKEKSKENRTAGNRLPTFRH